MSCVLFFFKDTATTEIYTDLHTLSRQDALPICIAREVLMDAGAPATITALSTGMACSTSMIGAIEAAGMINGTSRRLALVGGVESMSRVQIGLGQTL